ncbi:WD repeat-containing protein 91 [Pleodorina starrii]|nr:WD repeat-containing protein 91 [Pleodorina starrii]
MSLSVSVSVARPRCSHLGTFRGKLPFGIKPTGKVIEEPPQTASLTFNAAGQVEGYTMGYVMDRVRVPRRPVSCCTTRRTDTT